MKGDGVRRWRNGANSQPPDRGLVTITEAGWLDRALETLEVLAVALPRADSRQDAATAARAISRLFERDRYERDVLPGLARRRTTSRN